MRIFKARNCTIMCPGFTGAARCRAPPITPDVIAKTVSTDIYTEYNAAVMKVREQAIIATLKEDFDLQLKRAEEQWAHMSEKERKRRAHRNHIVERILNLACPRCGQAFVDFNGCFALKCSRCNAGFCAYCLEDCGNDAHAHVAACKFSTKRGEYFNTAAGFEEVQRERRFTMLFQYLEGLPPEECAEALEDIDKDLKDLGIEMGL